MLHIWGLIPCTTVHIIVAHGSTVNSNEAKRKFIFAYKMHFSVCECGVWHGDFCHPDIWCHLKKFNILVWKV